MKYEILETCRECGKCITECPAEAIKEGSPFFIESSLCMECGACITVCPIQAIVESSRV